jgi:NAD-dependent SIR2 family protein deacetylase
VASTRPLPEPALEITLDDLAEALRWHGPMPVITGAGISTASGIPDYRDHRGQWKRGSPMQLSEFTGSERGRQRYWARSLIGWHTVERARPNPAHEAMAALQAKGLIGPVITQNVDGLHQAAGAEDVLDLHGRLDWVECLDCQRVIPRDHHQQQLEAANPDWAEQSTALYETPDGDVELGNVDYKQFMVPGCQACGGMLKPAVVFFGEAVPPERVKQAFAALEAASALWVVGSSLMVWSGYRFVRAAASAGKPVYLLGLGVSRGDAEATGRVTADCTAALEALLKQV